MKKFSHKKKWNVETVQVHAESSLSPLIKSKNGEKLDENIYKLNCKEIWGQKILTFMI